MTTRRDILKSGPAALAAVALVPAALAASADDDAALFAYEPALLEAQAAHLAALDLQEAAEERFYAARPDEPPVSASADLPIVERDGAKWIMLPSPKTSGAGTEAARAAWLEAVQAAHDTTGLSAAEEASSEAVGAVTVVADAILATRARTLAGVAFKLRLCNISGGDVVAESLQDDLAALGFAVGEPCESVSV